MDFSAGFDQVKQELTKKTFKKFGHLVMGVANTLC
jgi:hypothetical protein